MNGQLTRDLLACVDENNDFDIGKFLSAHPLSYQVEQALIKLEQLGYVTIDYKHDHHINDFDITEKLLSLRKSV